ncbi:MAG: DUF3429 domain-containing protein [Pseudomonadota bacterium]
MSAIVPTLTFLGLVPFVAAAALVVIGVESLPYLGPIEPLLASYTLLIVSFMAGTHWGLSVARGGRQPAPLFLASILVALTAWFAFLFAPLQAALVIDAAALIVLLVSEHRYAGYFKISDDYLRLRTQVSAIAVATVLAASLAS